VEKWTEEHCPLFHNLYYYDDLLSLAKIVAPPIRPKTKKGAGILLT